MNNRRAVGKAVLLAFCWILSFAALSVTLTGTETFSFWMRVFVPVMLIFGYLSLWRIGRVFSRWQLWIAAAVFAAVLTVGASFDSAGTLEIVTSEKLKSLVFFAGRVPALYMGMVLAVEVMKKGKPLHHRYPAWVFALILYLCWLPYLTVVWPGTVSGGGTLLKTGLVVLAVLIGKGIFHSADAAIALYVLVQSLLMAWLLGRLVHRISSDGAPKWLTFASLVFFALCPVFPLYALAVAADTSFALAVLWLMLTIWRLLRSDRPAPWDAVSLCTGAVLCALLRSWGIWVAAGSLVVLLAWALYRRSELWHGAAYALTCAVCALVIVQGALLPMLRTMQAVDAETVSVQTDASFGYGYLMPGALSDSIPAFKLGTAEIIDGKAFAYTVNPHAEAIKTVFDRLLAYAPFRILIAPGLYGWIALFALAVVLARGRRQMLLFLSVPLLALAGCLAFSVSGDVGSALPVCMATPAFLAAAALAIRQTEADTL